MGGRNGGALLRGCFKPLSRPRHTTWLAGYRKDLHPLTESCRSACGLF